MRNSRGTLAWIMLIAVVAVSAVAVVRFRAWQLPAPKEADRAGLLRWIVIRDLSEEPPLVRGELARRFEEVFPAGLDWDTSSDRLDRSEIDRVRLNVSLLLEAWFLEQTERYSALAPANRLAHIDSVIDRITAWRQTVLLASADQNIGVQGSAEAALCSVLLDQTETWKQRADPARRERISQFLGVVQARWLLRRLTGDPGTG